MRRATKTLITLVVPAILLLGMPGVLGAPAVGGSGNSLTMDPVGDASPGLTDIVLVKMTQLGQERISFMMELAAVVMPNKTVLYSWFIDRAGTSDGGLNPGDFAVNLVYDGTSWMCNMTKVTVAAQPINGATMLDVNCSFAVAGSTVRVIVPFADLEKLNRTDKTFSSDMFFFWGVTRFGTVAPPNTDRAPDVPPQPGTLLWKYRMSPGLE